MSLVRGDLLFRLQRRIGLIPPEGLGLARRATFWALVAWLPVAAWAYWTGRVLPPVAGEPLLAHFGVHARCLVAIPLLVLAEGQAHRTTSQTVWPNWIRSLRVSFVVLVMRFPLTNVPLRDSGGN